ncbi:MAG: HK97 family phage prohead protease [Chloroflexi bacterium]|nr:HK97 family phage prohead protease [Chloroflexota bacterium]
MDPVNEIRCAVEVRADAETRGRRLVGTLMRYGTAGVEGRERFAPGALRWPDTGIVIDRQHNGRMPIMRVVPEVRGDSVVLDAPLPDTAAGRDAAREIRDGLFTGLSIEFRALRQRYERGVRVVTDALLLGAGLVHNPSYAASTAELRSRGSRRRNLYL